MKLPRRTFLQLAAGAAVLPAITRVGRAESYPSRPVHIIVPYAAGGPADIITRLMGQWLSERLGQQFVVENRPGAGGNIGTELVVRATADGYTLLQIGLPNAVNATLYGNLKFNFARDIVPVASFGRVAVIMVVNPSVPAKTVPEFIAYAKANPGKINMASSGNGTTAHMSGELFKMMTGVGMVHVAYRGQPQSLTDLISGRVQVMFDTTPPFLAHIKAGELRALAVASATPWEALPDLPTVGSFVPGYETSGWYGIGAPKGTPPAIVEILNATINSGLADPGLKGRFTDLGAMPLVGSPADFGKFISDETEKWGKVIRAAHIKVE